MYDNIKISIIIPIYNGETYFNRCISSIMNQTYQNMEIILINDGSTEQTGRLCDYYATLDNRIVVLHQENAGQSIARNNGIKSSSGDYICFVDIDDYLPRNALEEMLSSLKKKSYDIVCGTYYRVKDEEDKEVRKFNINSGEVNKNGDKLARKRHQILKAESVFGYVWGKLYKRSFIMQYHIYFDDITKVYMEDTLFNIKAYGQAPTYYFLNKPVYHYFIHSDSTSNKVDINITNRILASIPILSTQLKDRNTYEHCMDILVPFALRVFCWAIIKDCSYQKVKVKTVRKTLNRFTQNKSFLNIIKHKKAPSIIWNHPKQIEKLFYLICMFALRLKCYLPLAIMFRCSYTISNLYIRKNVK